MWTFIYATTCLAALALGNAVPDRVQKLKVRADTVPQSTPTGTFCMNGGEGTPSFPSPVQVASALAGCQGVTATGVTRNDIVDGLPCKPFTLIFARGTSETGNIGSIVGPPFVLALEKAFGGSQNVAVQGVNNYAAVTTEYCAGGSLTGAQNLADLVKQTMKQCPKTKLCVSGYSQGAQVVHNGAIYLEMSPAATKFINSVVTFGDPDRKFPVGKVPSNKVAIDCHQKDIICKDGDIIRPEHLTYCHDVDKYAAFAKARSQAYN